jgi:hypothetical protein
MNVVALLQSNRQSGKDGGVEKDISPVTSLDSALAVGL